MSEEYSLRKIAKLLKEGKARRTEKYVTFMFKLLFQRRGDNVQEEPKIADLCPDLAITRDGEIVSVIEIVDPKIDLRDENERKKFERVVLLAYAHIIKPKRLVLTDGISLIIYDSKLQPIKIVEDLEKVSEDEEMTLLNEITNPSS